MKKIMFLASFVCCAITLFGVEYISMISIENQWNELAKNLSIPPEYQYERTYITKLGQDTVINDTNYHELLIAKDSLSSNWTNNGYVREDTLNRKVFYKPKKEAEEILLYNFDALDMQVGNEFRSYDFYGNSRVTLRILSVEYDTIGGKNRMIATVRSTAMDVNCICEKDHVWIEGIGNLNGFLKSTTAVPLDGADRISLQCFFQNDELIYKPENTGVSECFVWRYLKDAKSSTIVNEQSSWAILSYGIGSLMMPVNVSTTYIYFGEDSVIAGQSYKKVLSCDDSLRENIKFEGLMREQYKKTYFIPENSETEYLFYDFSLEKGMSFMYTEYRWQLSEKVYVKEVDSVEINGVMKKRIQFTSTPTSEWVIETWIEGMGSLDDFLYPMHKSFIAGSVSKLLCFFQNNELIYKNPDYAKCYYDNAEELTSTQIATSEICGVYPNPVDDILVIFCPNNSISRAEIFDLSGHKIYGQSHGNPIDVRSFPKGFYVLKIYDNSGKVHLFKLIKN